MIFEAVSISGCDVRKLLSAANADAALLYIYLNSKNSLQAAGEELGLNESRISCAAAVLRQLGLWTEEKDVKIMAGERPSYTERDVLNAMDSDYDFRALYGELQRQLGRKILICVGDADNDLPMMEGADYAYCPADGVIADRFETVCPCGEGAVADVIYEKIPKILGLQP